jgi:hypothetical protein
LWRPKPYPSLMECVRLAKSSRVPFAMRRQIRDAYISGQGSLYAIGKAFGVSETAILVWHKREKWFRLRKAFENRHAFKLNAAQDIERVFSDTVQAIGKTGDPRERTELIKGLESAARCWSLLTGHAKPATRRPEKERARQLD